MSDPLLGAYLMAHYSKFNPDCATCIGSGDALEFLENDLVEFRYFNGACPFCMIHLRLNKRFPLSKWKPLLDAGHFTLLSDPVREHPERMRVVVHCKGQRAHRMVKP